MIGKKALGIDYGGRRIGLAISDGLRMTAQPYDTLDRRKLDKAAVVAQIVRIIEEQEIGEIVVGLPLLLSGQEGDAATKIRYFVADLEAAVSIPIILEDERMSSAMAAQYMKQADMNSRKRRGVIDKMAAVVILQGYLDRTGG